MNGVSPMRLLGRFDRWLVLRTPMLWRTRPVSSLLLLVAMVFVTLPFVQTKIDNVWEIQSSGVRSVWGLLVAVALVVVLFWVRSILRMPVGELPLYRHLVTVCAVGVGVYLWLVTPSALARVEIAAVARFGPQDLHIVSADLALFSRYRDWTCIPPGKEPEIEKLIRASDRYLISIDPHTEPAQIPVECPDAGAMRLKDTTTVSYAKGIVVTIRAARGVSSPGAVENPFSSIRASVYWFAIVALIVGLITTALSYPSYVWRRVLLRR